MSVLILILKSCETYFPIYLKIFFVNTYPFPQVQYLLVESEMILQPVILFHKAQTPQSEA